MTRTRLVHSPRGSVGVEMFTYPATGTQSGLSLPVFGVNASGPTWASITAAFEGAVHARTNVVQQYANFHISFNTAVAQQITASGRANLFTLQPSTGQFNLNGAVRASDGTTIDNPMVNGTAYSALVMGSGTIFASGVTQPSGTYVTLGGIQGGPSGIVLASALPQSATAGTTIPLTANFNATSGYTSAYTHDYAGITAGNYDSQIQAYANAAANTSTLIRFAHEMNGAWYPWSSKSPSGFTPAQYVSMWKHVRSVWQATETSASVPHVPWVWCANISNNTSANPAASGTQGSGSTGSQLPIYAPPSPGAEGTGSSMYPGDSQVEWIAIDGYSNPTSVQGANPSFSAVMKADLQWLRQAVSATRPLLVTETGTDASLGAGRAAWFSDMFTTLTATGTAGVLYFSSGNYTLPGDIPACQGLQAALEHWTRG